MLKVSACQTVCPVLSGWRRLPILWLRRGCRGLSGKDNVANYTFKLCHAPPAIWDCIKTKWNLYAACAKFKFPSEANNTNHKVVRGELISSMCWMRFPPFSRPQSLYFATLPLKRRLCPTWSDLRTTQGSGLRVRMSQCLRNTRASSWTLIPWRKMMNAELSLTTCRAIWILDAC